MDAVRVINDIVTRLLHYGVPVEFWPGWQTRGNGRAPEYKGLIVHHTASGYGDTYPTLVTGRADLSGPLCNFGGNADGTITVVSAGPANHAGASGGYGTYPLPVTSSFNKHTLGIEIVYPGVSPMTDAQYRAATILGACVSEVLGHQTSAYVKAHGETSVTGKWDPGYARDRMINMQAFRAEVQRLMDVKKGAPVPVPVQETHTVEDDAMYLFIGDADNNQKPDLIAILSGSLLIGLGPEGSGEYNSAWGNYTQGKVAAQWVEPGTFAAIDAQSHQLHDTPRLVAIVE